MCRLGLFNKQGLQKLGRDGLKVFLDHLEKQCGGHGNGIAFIDKGVCTLTEKGMLLTNDMIVEGVFDELHSIPDWLIYHTRIASKGSIKDSNCHPYWNEDKSFVLAMNGTVSPFGDLSKSLDITDTELIFKNLNTFNIPEENLTELTPRFLGFRHGKVFATNPSGVTGGLQFEVADESIIIASSFPLGYKGNVKDMDTSYCWHEGEELKEKVKVVYKYNEYSWYERMYGLQKKADTTTPKKETKKEPKPVPKKKKEKDPQVGLSNVIRTEMELVQLLDDINTYLYVGCTLEEAEDYCISQIGTLEPLTKYGAFSITIDENGAVLLDETGTLYY